MRKNVIRLTHCAMLFALCVPAQAQQLIQLTFDRLNRLPFFVGILKDMQVWDIGVFIPTQSSQAALRRCRRRRG